MKNNAYQRKILCVALTAMLALGDYAGGTVYAAQTEKAQEKETHTEKTQGQETLTENPDKPFAESGMTDEELAAYYGESVFIGDSIMVGFRNYSAKQESFVHDIQFLAVGSYSAFNAMKPVADDNVHPLYKGKKTQLWDAVPLTDSKRAFLLLGMNDISILGLEGARDQYKELIEKILEASPDIEIHIISVTYTLPDQGKGKLNNDNIAAYNVLLQEMAEKNGWGYIDLCTSISDGEGNLAEECCSDGFVHLTNAAYALWESDLIDYANAQNAPEEAEEESAAKEETESETESVTDASTEPKTITKSDNRSKITSILGRV